jgi:hypothetical protein
MACILFCMSLSNLAVKGIKKMQEMCTMKYYSALKKKEILLYATR